MPDVPKEAVNAAEAARLRFFDEAPYWGSTTSAEVTRIMLEAAAPILADEVARKILLHMDRSTRRRNSRNRRGLLAYRRHFGTAARIAAGAFTTDAELKRMAAEALNRAYRERSGC